MTINSWLSTYMFARWRTQTASGLDHCIHNIWMIDLSDYSKGPLRIFLRLQLRSWHIFSDPASWSQSLKVEVVLRSMSSNASQMLDDTQSFAEFYLTLSQRTTQRGTCNAPHVICNLEDENDVTAMRIGGPLWWYDHARQHIVDARCNAIPRACQAIHDGGSGRVFEVVKVRKLCIDTFLSL